jgi:hypothetical protein
MTVKRDTILRGALLIGALLAALIFANMAASLVDVWQLQPGGVVPAPWDELFGAGRATQRTDLLALVGAAALAGASLACLVFILERMWKEGWAWLQDKLRK